MHFRATSQASIQFERFAQLGFRAGDLAFAVGRQAVRSDVETVIGPLTALLLAHSGQQVGAQAVLSAGVAALISTRVATYRAAYQLNGLVVLPIVTMLIPQTMVLFFVTPWALLLLACFFGLIDLILIYTAISFFDRERLLKGQ